VRVSSLWESFAEAPVLLKPNSGFQRRIATGAFWAALALCLIAGCVPALAQKAKPRKVISEVKPVYPVMLKTRHIAGQVHLTAVVLPNGTVAAVEVHGGNPILVENAVKAVKNWKYAPGPEQTEEDIVLNFVE